MDRDLVLVAGADDAQTYELSLQLGLDGYQTLAANAEAQLSLMLADHQPSALLLADMPTLLETFTFVRALRDGAAGRSTIDRTVPLLLVSATNGELAEARAFEAGADDFQPLGGSHVVLCARLAGLLRRSRQTREPQRLQVGELVIDLAGRVARYRGRRVELTRKEFELLVRLAAEPTRLIAPGELLRDVWGYPDSARTRTLNAHACRLRTKLAAAGAAGLIANSPGQGYRLAGYQPSTSAPAPH